MVNVKAMGAVLAAAAAFSAVPAAAVTPVSRTITQTIPYVVNFTTTTQYNNSPVNNLTITPGQTLTFTINQFNPTGLSGQTFTLTNVVVRVTSQLGGTISLNNGSGNARNGDLTFTLGNSFTIDLPGPTDFVATTNPGSTVIPFTIPGQSQGSIGIAGTNTSSSGNFTPSSFVPYVGTGTFNVTQSLANFFSDITLTSGGKGNLNGSSTANVNGNFVIEYTYLDPIPEPSNWAMMIAGFGLVGAMARRRRPAMA